MKESFPPFPESIHAIQTFIKDRIRSREKPVGDLFRIDLIVEEIVVNIIRYGQKEGSDGRIDVMVDTSGDEVIMEISDNGPAFNPLEQGDPDTSAPLDQRRPGGLGIFLVRRMTRDMRYERRSDRNVLRLVLDI